MVEAMPAQALAGYTPSAPPQGIEAPEECRHLEASPKQPNQPKRTLRMLAVGKTGGGKSATCNSLAGSADGRRCDLFQESDGFLSTQMEDVFKVATYNLPPSVCNGCGTLEHMEIEMKLIDAPGIMDTTLSEEKIYRHIAIATLSAPTGLDAFLCAIKFGRLTDEELRSLDVLESIFGDTVWGHTILVFTDCSLSIDGLAERLEKTPAENKLRKVWDKCGRRAVPIQNGGPEADADMPEKLLASCSRIHQHAFELYSKNSPYTNEAFDKAAEVKEQAEEEMKGKMEALQQEWVNIESLKRQQKMSDEAYQSRKEVLLHQEKELVREKAELEMQLHMQLEESKKFVQDVMYKVQCAAAGTAIIAATSTAGLYAMASAFNAAASAASCAAPALMRLGFPTAVAVYLSRWWNVSLSFGGRIP